MLPKGGELFTALQQRYPQFMGLCGYVVVHLSTTAAGTETGAIAAEGTGFYPDRDLRLESAVQGAQVTRARVTDAGLWACQQGVGTFLTNSTGSVLRPPARNPICSR